MIDNEFNAKLDGLHGCGLLNGMLRAQVIILDYALNEIAPNSIEMAVAKELVRRIGAVLTELQSQ